MSRQTRLNSEERRESILHAIRKSVAEKGLEGMSTRELAESAGISEALLFKHFPDKKNIYSSLLISCYRVENRAEIDKVMSLKPSTVALVAMVRLLASKIILGWLEDGDDKSVNRLILRSILEDGRFAKTFIMKQFHESWLVKFKECLKAAEDAGDIETVCNNHDILGWFVHHLPCMVMICNLPSDPIIDYGVSKEELIDQMVNFLLRGIGLIPEKIKSCNELVII